MIFKHRSEPLELKLLGSLNNRMSLSKKEALHYQNLKKGFEGEVLFDKWCEYLSGNFIILNDLLLEVNSTTFQIDSLLITNGSIVLFEVKNFEYDYFIKKDIWYTLSGMEVKDPLLQLQRNESLMRRLLHELGFNYPLKSYLIFVNPEFHLYQAPLNEAIIFPTQLKRFINKLNKLTLSTTQRDLKLAEKLVSMHLKESRFLRLPDYRYDQLKKGITCGVCNDFIDHAVGKSITCNACGHKEEISIGILRCIEEYKKLFPERKITTKAIHDWCEIISSKKIIRRILFENFKLVRYSKYSYYEVPENNSDSDNC